MPNMTGQIDERTGQVIPYSPPPTGNTPIFTNQMTGTSTAPTGTGVPLDGSATGPMTGWAGAQNFTPAQMPTIYENPWFLLPHLFPQMQTTDPLYQSLRDFGADPLALYNIAAGSQGVVDQSGNAQGNDYANWVANLYKQMSTPGGQGISAGNLIRMLFGEGAEGPETSLGQILGAGDMGTQVRTMFNMLRDVSNAGMNPLAARGYQSALAQAGDQYGASQLTAGPDSSMSFQQWANQNAPWLTGR